ncbi:ATP-binding protein [Photobacterium sp. OFAV2-7]|uniref:AAA family ATPase n=1 Tax=Photobacterium sp. OFAV2-7 TaxID=2917748 RepID=UPI001EF46067|nr:ATP-binding protein [Photobacterium sp. OFAV2-7]MCG7585956.1 ATP-binding protein [Photobacterium sp. OFAV2-7]
MARIYFICGFIGSGKTTYSKQLVKDEQAFRFSIDEWMIPLYGEHMEREMFDARIATLTDLFKQSALQMLELGVSVIFDFGFWTRSDRKEIEEWAKKEKVDYELIYLDVDFETCSQRALARNSVSGKESFDMTPEMLSLFWSWFEVPSHNENITKIKVNG